MQNRYQDTPKYYETNIVNNNMHKIFTYIVKDRDNNILGSSEGISKKDAENNSSYEALKYYGEII
jgi:dsRNA-specific ribonuclease